MKKICLVSGLLIISALVALYAVNNLEKLDLNNNIETTHNNLSISKTTLPTRTDASDLFISEYIEGSSNNKAIEIFNGTGATVDLSNYTVKLATNGNAWSTSVTLSGTLNNNDVYVIAHSQASAEIKAKADLIHSVTNFNGNDCVGLFQGNTMIDIIGIYQNDPGNNSGWSVAGVPAATLNHTLIRKPTVIQGNTDWTISAGTNADDSEWIVQAQDYITDLGTHTFTPNGEQYAATPTFNPPAGLYETPQTITISSTTPGVTIRYTTDGTTPTETEGIIYTEPITLSVTTTLKAVAYGEGYSISPVAQALYIFPVNVSTIADLRAGTPGTYYKYSGTGVLTFQQTFRNQKFIQDNTAAILIDDLNGKITTTYNLYDGISNIIGTVNEYGGMMQLTPYSDPGPAVSTGNVIIPPEISLNELVTNFEQYESELVKVMGVYFDTADNVITFTNGTLYPMNSGLMNFRTTFYDVDYIGMVVPTGLWNIIGIPNSRVAEGNLFTARFWADFSSAEQPPLPVVLTSFTAIIAGENCVNISWITESENELLGYYIYRSTDDKLENAQRISEMIAANNSSSQYIYTYTDNEVFNTVTYYYWLQSIELGGITTIYGPVSVYYSPMNDNPTPEVPFETALGPIYPNPFNPVVFIPYSLAEATDLNLYIYNSRGQLIRHFYVGTQEPGYYRLSWDGTDSKGTACSNGIYQIVMKTGKNVFSRKAALMK